jgi:tRNA dimethylallyltransferase
MVGPESWMAGDAGVTVEAAPIDDGWFRDNGPSFVIDTEGRLAGVNWDFNGWGRKSGISYWRDRAAAIGAEHLYHELRARDPAMAARLTPTDSQRLVRALEVIDATSISLAEWQVAGAAPLLAPEGVVRIVIAPEREALYAAIDARFDTMIEAGAVEEVRSLVALGLDTGLPAMRAHGVRELALYLSRGSRREEAIAKAKTETRRYAKRQMTWLKRFMKDWDWAPEPGAAVNAVLARLATR